MLTISSAEFDRYLGHYKDVAAGEPLAVTSYGRPRIIVLPAANYEWLADVASAVTMDIRACREIGNFLAGLNAPDQEGKEPATRADQA